MTRSSSRREFLAMASLAAGSTLVDTVTAEPWIPVNDNTDASTTDLTEFVNVFIGTGGHGHCYPGATVPFGAVQLSPDTGSQGWDWCSGYHHDDSTLMGFSHTHLSGTGGGDMLDLLLVPRTGAVVLNPGSEPDARKNPAGTYRSNFSHADEAAEPGYYSVLTSSTGGAKIRTELTATERTGFARFSFPPQEPAYVLLDWQHLYGGGDGVKEAQLQVAGDRLILGGRRVNRWAPDREIYFATEVSVAPTKVEVFRDDTLFADKSVQGRNIKVVFHFAPGTKVLVRSGLSLISAENALKNLRAEQPDWDFEKTRAAAKRSWHNELRRIQIEDGDRDRKIVFYSALYHMMCAPTLADDVTGEYRGLDKKVHKLASGEHNYSTYSLWDTYRSLHPSYTLWQRDRVPEMVNCLVRMAEQSIYGFPVWPLQDGETYCMPGYHAASVMAEACVKKVPGIDWNKAYAGMRKRNMDDDYMGLAQYRQHGYIPAGNGGESIGKLVEYVYCDWACSKVADATGHPEDAEVMRKRSQNYKNVFDRESQFIRPKMENGSWAPNFDPRATGHVPHRRDYTEANAWQSTFFIQHDVKGYMQMFGGRESFVRKLDALFTAEPGVSNETVVDMTGFIGQYVHGNEPSHHITYLYTWAGQPWKTQERVREILLTHYRNDFDGLDGNEDCGQMSAWFVLSALGIYAVDPVSATYVLSAPLFDRAVIDVGGGRKLTIVARRRSPDDKYIQRVMLDRVLENKLWVRYDDLVNGGELVFELGPEPNKTLGAEESTMPPSLTA